VPAGQYEGTSHSPSFSYGHDEGAGGLGAGGLGAGGLGAGGLGAELLAQDAPHTSRTELRVPVMQQALQPFAATMSGQLLYWSVPEPEGLGAGGLGAGGLGAGGLGAGGGVGPLPPPGWGSGAPPQLLAGVPVQERQQEVLIEDPSPRVLPAQPLLAREPQLEYRSLQPTAGAFGGVYDGFSR